jgi:hypothetical protein
MTAHPTLAALDSDLAAAIAAGDDAAVRQLADQVRDPWAGDAGHRPSSEGGVGLATERIWLFS